METSESWEPIYRYDEESINDFKPVSWDSSEEDISNHIEKYIWKIEMVYHEILSDTVHIDIFWVKPTLEKPFHTLITSWMSNLPMSVPKDFDDFKYSELYICLPEEWEISIKTFEDINSYWPISWLKYLALFPHKFNTWLSYWHTIPNGEPAEPFSENTKLNTILILNSIIFNEGFNQLKLKNKTINFFSLIPLYTEEVNLKLKKGSDALFNGFNKYWVNEILNINRENTVKKKKLFWLF